MANMKGRVEETRVSYTSTSTSIYSYVTVLPEPDYVRPQSDHPYEEVVSVRPRTKGAEIHVNQNEVGQHCSCWRWVLCLLLVMAILAALVAVLLFFFYCK